MSKPFFEVFPSLQLNTDIRDLMGQTEVERVSATKRRDFLRVYLKSTRLIQKTDKRRAAYCEYYASKKWGAVDGYDFCLNSSALGLSGTVELIRVMVDHKENPIPSPTEVDPTQA